MSDMSDNDEFNESNDHKGGEEDSMTGGELNTTADSSGPAGEDATEVEDEAIDSDGEDVDSELGDEIVELEEADESGELDEGDESVELLEGDESVELDEGDEILDLEEENDSDEELGEEDESGELDETANFIEDTELEESDKCPEQDGSVELGEGDESIELDEGDEIVELNEGDADKEGDESAELEDEEGGETAELEDEEGDETAELEDEEGDETAELEDEEGDETAERGDKEGDETAELEDEEGDETAELEDEEGDETAELGDKEGDETAELEEDAGDKLKESGRSIKFDESGETAELQEAEELKETERVESTKLEEEDSANLVENDVDKSKAESSVAEEDDDDDAEASLSIDMEEEINGDLLQEQGVETSRKYYPPVELFDESASVSEEFKDWLSQSSQSSGPVREVEGFPDVSESSKRNRKTSHKVLEMAETVFVTTPVKKVSPGPKKRGPKGKKGKKSAKPLADQQDDVPQVQKTTSTPTANKNSPVTPKVKPDDNFTVLQNGWSIKAIQRKSGAQAGKYDVYIYNPDGKKFRSRNEIRQYCETNGLELDMEIYSFNVNDLVAKGILDIGGMGKKEKKAVIQEKTKVKGAKAVIQEKTKVKGAKAVIQEKTKVKGAKVAATDMGKKERKNAAKSVLAQKKQSGVTKASQKIVKKKAQGKCFTNALMVGNDTGGKDQSPLQKLVIKMPFGGGFGDMKMTRKESNQIRSYFAPSMDVFNFDDDNEGDLMIDEGGTAGGDERRFTKVVTKSPKGKFSAGKKPNSGKKNKKGVKRKNESAFADEIEGASTVENEAVHNPPAKKKTKLLKAKRKLNVLAVEDEVVSPQDNEELPAKAVEDSSLSVPDNCDTEPKTETLFEHNTSQASDNLEDQTDTATPVPVNKKRGRGRPPKNKKPATISDDVDRPPKNKKPATISDDVDGPPKNKKPATISDDVDGPPKNKKPATISDDVDGPPKNKKPATISDDVGNSQNPSVKKRGRGRPPKSETIGVSPVESAPLLDEVTPVINSEPVFTPDVDAGNSQNPSVKKRGRGRPPKSETIEVSPVESAPLLDEVTPVIDSEPVFTPDVEPVDTSQVSTVTADDEIETPQPVKKKRGRKPKHKNKQSAVVAAKSEVKEEKEEVSWEDYQKQLAGLTMPSSVTPMETEEICDNAIPETKQVEGDSTVVANEEEAKEEETKEEEKSELPEEDLLSPPLPPPPPAVSTIWDFEKVPVEITADYILNNSSNTKNNRSVKKANPIPIITTRPKSKREEKWIPPHSPFCLVHESLSHDPWKLLVATILMDKSTGFSLSRQPIPILWKLLNKWPRPELAREADMEEMAEVLFPLGRNYTRASTIIQFSDEFLRKKWTYPEELHGVSKYGNDSYRMFCVDEWKKVEPCDQKLTDYQQWLMANEKQLGLV